MAVPFLKDVLYHFKYQIMNDMVIPPWPFIRFIVTPWPAGCRFGSLHGELGKETAVHCEDDRKAWIINGTSSHKAF